MAAKTIGDQSFLTMTGRPDVPAQAVEPLENRPGENYTRFRKHGLRAADAQIQTMRLTDNASLANAYRAAYKALQGTAITIVDAFSISHANCMIEHVAVEFKYCYSGAANYIRVEAVWTVRQGGA